MSIEKIDLDSAAPLLRKERVVQAEVDGELVLLSPKGMAYYGAVGTGDSIWELIDGTRSTDGIIESLETQFDAEPGIIREQVTEFIEGLIVAGLLEATS
jgi:hypothetical protein